MTTKHFFKNFSAVQQVALTTIITSSLFFQNVSAQSVDILPELSSKYRSADDKANTQQRTTIDKLRKWITENKRSFNVGLTSIIQMGLQPPEEGGSRTTSYTKTAVANRHLSKEGQEALSGLRPACIATAKSYDARQQNYITPIRTHSICRYNDYAYAAVAAFEASFIRINGASVRSIDCSEQYIANCFLNLACTHWYGFAALSWIVDKQIHLEKESVMPESNSNSCPVDTPATNYVATDWGFIREVSSTGPMPTVPEIKAAICKYGSVVSDVKITTAFMAYTNGVFYELESRPTNDMMHGNHSVLLIGWDDDKSAWLIKNSWGTYWGEDGYMWIKYNSNDIGKKAAWVVAKKVSAAGVRQ